MERLDEEYLRLSLIGVMEAALRSQAVLMERLAEKMLEADLVGLPIAAAIFRDHAKWLDDNAIFTNAPTEGMQLGAAYFKEIAKAFTNR